MNTRLLLLTTILVADLSLAALPPETLPLAVDQQIAAQQALARQDSEANATLRKWYESALDAVKKDATAKGDLNSVLAADQERERVDRDLTPEEKTKLPPAMRKVRDQYDQARVQVGNQQKAKLAASLRAYITTLEALEKRFTQNSDIEKALASRDERTKAEEQLKVLTPTAVPPGPAPAASTPVAAKPPLVKGQTPAVVPEPETAGGNLFQNPNFENGTEGWKITAWGKTGTMTVDEEEKHNGKPSLRVENPGPQHTLVNQKVTVKPKTRYVLSGYIKTKNVEPPKPGQKEGAELMVTGGSRRSEPVSKTTSWKRVSYALTTLEGETEMVVGISLGHYNSPVKGTAWFSELSLTELVPNAKK